MIPEYQQTKFHTRNHERDRAVLAVARRCQQERKVMPKLDVMARHFGFSWYRMRTIIRRLRAEGRLVTRTERVSCSKGWRTMVVEVRE